MSRMLHMRGDVTGMLAFFAVFFLGCWQLAVAAYRINGLSLTGHPDRRRLSFAAGVTLMSVSLAFYFSRPGHFASPDVEGIETLVLMTLGLLAATAAQAALASLSRLHLARRAPLDRGVCEEIRLELEGGKAPACFYPGRRDGPAAVLLLHEYGGCRFDVSPLALGLSGKGYPCLAVQLDGHGDSPREITDPCMEPLLRAALAELRARSGMEKALAAGVGLGGTLAFAMAARGEVAAAVALDPPALGPEGRPAVNAFAELSPAAVLYACLRPPARAAGGGRMSQSALLGGIPEPVGGLPKATIIGTRDRWYNSPAALREYAARLGASYETVGCSHAGMAAGGEALEALHRALAEAVPV